MAIQFIALKPLNSFPLHVQCENSPSRRGGTQSLVAAVESIPVSVPWEEQIPPNAVRRKRDPSWRGGFSLGVDLGLSRTGIAISKGFTVRPLTVVEQNRLRIKVSIDVVKLCALLGIAFRGRDEQPDSLNRGNFLEIVKHTASYIEEVASVVLENAPKNATYASHWIQNEILSLYKSKIQKFIRAEIGDQKFCILVDESRDESKREQMAIILRFIDKDGFVRERFFDIVHVKDTRASTLKTNICEVLSNHELNVQNIRGQGYDGASNMRGEWNAAAERGWRVYLQDEHGTSSEAMDHMIAKGLSKSAREGKLDAYAAMKVLERYFSHSGTSIELVVPKQVELQNKLRILTSTQKNSKHCKENCQCIFCSKYAVLHCQGTSVRSRA